MKNDPKQVRVTGPLAPFAEGFRQELAMLGYTGPSAANQLRLVAHVSRWLADEGLDAGELTSECVERFVDARCAEGYSGHRSAQGLNPLLGYLRVQGAAPAAFGTPPTASSELLARYRQYLVAERGLQAGTVALYEVAARAFLATRQGVDGLLLASLSPADISHFVLGECTRRNVASAKNMATGLRSLLRFLYVTGATATSLVGAVPTVPNRRGGSLPRAMEADALGRLLAACDRRTPAGRRDLAVLTLLARLGLRAGEVAAIELGDVDWRRGEIMVHGKGNRHERLPLPVDVGEAIADYVRRGRPKVGAGPLFLRLHAPLCALSAGGVKTIVRAGCDRAGLPPMGAHRLRHTAATQMLRRGAGLTEIAQVLRHRSIDTTAIYAKVDVASLFELARPWPGGAA